MYRVRRDHKRSWKTLWMAAVVMLFITSVCLPLASFAEEERNDEKILRDKRYFYKAFGRRDPFQSLIVGELEEAELELVDIYAVKLVGVLSGGMEKYAMLEDKNGFGYILKAGDPIRNGTVVSVADVSLVARISSFGQTNTVTLRLDEKKKNGK